MFRYFLIVFFLFHFSVVIADDWPTKPITLLIPLPAGGGTDAVYRILGKEMSGILGQPIVVDNRPGAAGRIGLLALSKSQSDGYTIGAVTSGPLIAVPASSKVVPYDPVKDFTSLALLYEVYTTFLVAGNLPVDSVKSLVAYAKANPKVLNYGSIGNGSVAHFITEHWKRSVGIEIEHIPYKGEPQAIQDLLAGRLQIYISPSPYLDFVANGKLKALATTGPKRTQIQPGIPTMDELGFPTASMSVLFGLFAPANVPHEIAKKLSNAALEALRMSSVQKQINDFGYITRGEGPERMKDIVQEDFIKFKTIAKEANIVTD